MKQFYTLFLFLMGSLFYSQEVTGEIVLKGLQNVYISKIYITNLDTQKTVLATFRGQFKINAKVGDVLRITSNRTERKDIKVNTRLIEQPYVFIEIELTPREIEEVVISTFKPTGNLKKDVEKLHKVKNDDENEKIKEMIGLPKPIVPEYSSAPISLANGGFNLDIQSVYDIFSGEMKKKQRRLEYEKMQEVIRMVRNSVEEQYFSQLRIPQHLIDNFLEFIYKSENKNLNEINVRFLSQKYNPIYQKRLENSLLIK